MCQGMTHSRTVNLEGVKNARHLGGIAIGDGVFTVCSDLIRSGSLNRLSPTGIGAIRDLGVRTVIDLRAEEELLARPTPPLGAFGIDIVWAPVFEKELAPLGVHTETGHWGYAWAYQATLERGRKAYRKVFEVLAGREDGVLIHCAGGIDRTGIAVTLLLGCAGASNDVILAEHAVSTLRNGLADNDVSGAVEEQWRAASTLGLAATLDLVRERWGSIEGYLAEAGVVSAVVRTVRARVLHGLP